MGEWGAEALLRALSEGAAHVEMPNLTVRKSYGGFVDLDVIRDWLAGTAQPRRRSGPPAQPVASEVIEQRCCGTMLVADRKRPGEQRGMSPERHASTWPSPCLIATTP